MFREVRRPSQADEFNPVAGCEACEKNVALRQGLTPIYSYQFWETVSGPPFGLHFSVPMAQAILRQRMAECLTGPIPSGFMQLDVENIAKWMEHALDVSEEHALHHITDQAAWVPGIMLPFTMDAIPDYWRFIIPSRVEPCSILMDGNHRALRHLRQNTSMAIYVMTLEEMRSCFAGLEVGNLLTL